MKWGAFMWMDIVVVIIIVLSMVDGLRRGFIRTATDTFGWIIALILAYIWYPSVAFFIKTNTDLYTSVLHKITLKLSISGNGTLDEFINGLPPAVGDAIRSVAGQASTNLGATIAETLFNIICFVAVVFLIRLVLVIFASLISKGNKDNIIGGLDRLAGLFAGTIKGIIVVYFFLALATAVIGFSNGNFLKSSLEKAPLTKYMYEHNLIFIVIKGVL